MPPIRDGRAPVLPDLILGVGLILVSAWVFWDTRHLPPPVYEPLGAAAIPRGIAALLGGFGGIIAALALAGRSPGALASAGDGDRPVPRPWLAVQTCLIVAAYAAAMHAGLLGFRIATFLFLAVTCMVLSDFRRSYLPAIVVMAIGSSLGLHYVFTQFFVLDLP